MVDRTHDPEIARHGKLAPRSAARSALRLVGIAVCVLVLSAAGVAAYGVWDVARSVKPGVTLSKLGGGTQKDIPDVGALKGGVNLVLVGTDSREGLGGPYDNPADQAEGGAGHNDVTMLLHIAADHRSAAVVSFPRDMMTELPDCSDPASGSGHFAQFNTALSDGGLSCVVLAVSKLTGLDIPFGAVVNFAGVTALSDAVGGVTVCLASPMRDNRTHPALDLSAGEHTLVGAEAQSFLRSRHGVGDASDLSRISSQQVFLSALARKIVNGGVLGDPVKLYALAKAAVANITPSDTLRNPTTLVQIALAVKNTGLENMVFLQYPVVDDPDDPNRVVPDEAAAAAVGAALVADRPLRLSGAPGRAAEPQQGSTPAPGTSAPGTGAPATTGPTPGTPAPGSASSSPSAPSTPGSDGTLPDTVTGQTAAQQTCAKGRVED
ncbi:LCP family protein [Leifsonia sp. NPDC080035]|uniref:LCP family protein n=1 Tax=Leifsonia sp. NPDC080035 TaxID=3143936 RepID=A0AAU7GCJ2_9MICO